MPNYSSNINQISSVLNCFVRDRHIVIEKMTVIDTLIDASYKDQVNVLNNTLLKIGDQRILFGAVRNIRNTMLNMKESLKMADAKKENPIAAETCLEIIPYIKTLGEALDNLFSNLIKMSVESRLRFLERIKEFSRILHKKAIQFGFSSIIIEKQELDIDENEMKKFIDEFNNELKLGIEIDEEPLNEGND